MAYICRKSILCTMCRHYRWNEDEEEHQCFAAQDEALIQSLKFVSYDGEYPNLCRGTLVLSTNGKEYTCKRCLMSGGRCYFDWNHDEHTERGRWRVDVEELPKELVPIAREVEKLVNNHVPYGCCGGCL